MKRILNYILFLLIFWLIGFYFWPEEKLDTTKKIDKIIVTKHKRTLDVFSNGEKLKTYKIALGRVPVGAKEFEGDKKTPEGVYTINDKNPNSGYHLNLGISYPNKEDIKYANAKGKSPGSLIKIHGLRNGLGIISKFHRFTDWTLGCIAVTNEEVEELYYNVPIGTTIEIKP